MTAFVTRMCMKCYANATFRALRAGVFNQFVKSFGIVNF